MTYMRKTEKLKQFKWNYSPNKAFESVNEMSVTTYGVTQRLNAATRDLPVESVFPELNSLLLTPKVCEVRKISEHFFS